MDGCGGDEGWVVLKRGCGNGVARPGLLAPRLRCSYNQKRGQMRHVWLARSEAGATPVESTRKETCGLGIENGELMYTISHFSIIHLINVSA